MVVEGLRPSAGQTRFGFGFRGHSRFLNRRMIFGCINRFIVHVEKQLPHGTSWANLLPLRKGCAANQRTVPSSLAALSNQGDCWCISYKEGKGKGNLHFRMDECVFLLGRSGSPFQQESCCRVRALPLFSFLSTDLRPLVFTWVQHRLKSFEKTSDPCFTLLSKESGSVGILRKVLLSQFLLRIF